MHADDLIVTVDDKSIIQSFKKDMMQACKMSYLGLLHYFLRIENFQLDFYFRKIFAESMLKKFRMESCKSVATSLTANEKLKKEDGTGEYVVATMATSQAIWL